MSDIIANRCFVCGPENPVGLQLKFRLEDDQCRAEFTPGENHVGYHNVVHGGLLFSVLDDVMANWLYLKEIQAFTGKANVRYRREGRVGDTLALSGWCIEEKGRLYRMQSQAISVAHGDVVCEADAVFMRAR
ncbi:MAG: PaaI family thioesterase [Pseudomonadota bacterium]